MASLKIPRQFVDEMIAHAQQDDPNECCGILIGENGAVISTRRVTNIVDEEEQAVPVPDGAAGVCVHRRGVLRERVDAMGLLSFPHAVAGVSVQDGSEPGVLAGDKGSNLAGLLLSASLP